MFRTMKLRYWIFIIGAVSLRERVMRLKNTYNLFIFSGSTSSSFRRIILIWVAGFMDVTYLNKSTISERRTRVPPLSTLRSMTSKYYNST